MDKAYKCRICNSNLFNKLVHLKEMPLTDDFVKVNESKVEFLQDIEIYQCSSCNLVQNPVDLICQRSTNCSRIDNCENFPKSRKKISWTDQIKEDILNKKS